MEKSIKEIFSQVKEICTNKNKKLGGGILQCNMPYITTCRCDAPCKKECYCNRGHLLIANKHHVKRYEMYKASPDLFFNKIDVELQTSNFSFFRWHSSGDIVDERYFLGMVETAKKHSEIKFLAFTKKYEIVNNFLDKGGILPKNFNVVYSAWGAGWSVPNPHNLPVSHIETGNALFDSVIPSERAYKCSGFCGTCVKGVGNCWDLKRGECVVIKKH